MENTQANTLLYEGETFYRLVGATPYFISKSGRIWSTRCKRLLKQTTANTYQHVRIYYDGQTRGTTCLTHRVVAAQFLPNPANKYSVNHIDGNKANNCLSNLEWATMKEQQRHALDTGLRVPKSGPEHHSFGAQFSQQTKDRMSEAKKGEKHPRFKGYYLTPWGQFTTARQASATPGCPSYVTVCSRCAAPAGTYPGWGFLPA